MKYIYPRLKSIKDVAVRKKKTKNPSLVAATWQPTTGSQVTQMPCWKFTLGLEGNVEMIKKIDDPLDCSLPLPFICTEAIRVYNHLHSVL